MDRYDEGVFALCPPIRDLQLLEEWEVNDWEERIGADILRDRRVPSPEVLHVQTTPPLPD